jgi:flavin-dependent dehydrogenase
MPARYDVVIVGARCAGSPLATLLARHGVSVAVMEQAAFPREVMCSHGFEADALAFLHRLGVSERLREAGARFVVRVDGRSEDVRWRVDWPQRPGDIGGIASVRRSVLDAILVGAARDAGATVRMNAKVTSLLRDGGRVTGVRVEGAAGEEEVRARLVVGADGRRSSVARLAGARRYNVTRNERALYWTHFENAVTDAEPVFVYHRWADKLVISCPADAGLQVVIVLPELGELDGFRGDLERRFMAHALACEPVARVLEGARRADRILGVVRWEGYFREPSGPGWVLVGDAGHFKDPAPGRGIGDAFAQVDALAPKLAGALAGSDAQLDAAMAAWGHWRDAQSAERYWFAADLGAAGRLPAVLPEIIRGLSARGTAAAVLEVTSNRARPSEVLTPPRLLAATGRLLARPGVDRRRVLRETGTLLREDTRRRVRNRRPVYAPAATVRVAGPGGPSASG